MERDWWHIIPLGDNKGTFDTDIVLPPCSALLRISNQVDRALLLEIEIGKTFGKGCKLDRNSIDLLKSCNLFHNKHL